MAIYWIEQQSVSVWSDCLCWAFATINTSKWPHWWAEFICRHKCSLGTWLGHKLQKTSFLGYLWWFSPINSFFRICAQAMCPNYFCVLTDELSSPVRSFWGIGCSNSSTNTENQNLCQLPSTLMIILVTKTRPATLKPTIFLFNR